MRLAARRKHFKGHGMKSGAVFKRRLAVTLVSVKELIEEHGKERLAKWAAFAYYGYWMFSVPGLDP